jgi:transposase
MEVLYPRCAGLDVHKDSVVAAVRLAGCGCTQAVMEATGVYWKPVWHVLSDGELTLILANAAHVNV